MPKNPLDLSIGKELFRGSTSFLGEGKKPKKKEPANIFDLPKTKSPFGMP